MDDFIAYFMREEDFLLQTQVMMMMSIKNQNKI